MKKLKRNTEKFDVLELFSSMAIKHGYKLTEPTDIKDFVKRVEISIEASKKNNITIFGKRTESLFAYVVGALAEVKLLKQEDSGFLYSSESAVQVPDFRLTLNCGEQFLVEVKNYHERNPSKKFSIKKNYYDKLKKYSDLNKIELKFAIFFSAWNFWVLLPINAFQKNEDSYVIDIGKAVALSEMATLGDCMVGTTPDLELHMLANEEEASEINAESEASFITRQVKIYCAGKEVIDSVEQSMAIYLIRFGEWKEKKTEAIIEKNKLIGMKFIYSPEGQPEPNFTIIGTLSTMISNGFKEYTVEDGNVVALDLAFPTDVFRFFIPKDYKGKNLPLWQFKTQPNENFRGTSEVQG